MNILAALKGKKIYIMTALTIAASIAGVLTKTMSPAEAVAAIGAATGLSTVRAGSKNDAAAVIDHVTEATGVITALAPIAAAALPAEAQAVGEAAAIAAQIGKAMPV